MQTNQLVSIFIKIHSFVFNILLTGENCIHSYTPLEITNVKAPKIADFTVTHLMPLQGVIRQIQTISVHHWNLQTLGHLLTTNSMFLSSFNFTQQASEGNDHVE